MNIASGRSARSIAGLFASVVAAATIVVPSIALACDPGSVFPCDDNGIGVKKCIQATNCPTSNLVCDSGSWAWCCTNPNTGQIACACRGASEPRPRNCINAT